MLMINDAAHAHAKLGILHTPWGMVPLKALKKKNLKWKHQGISTFQQGMLM